MKSLALYSITVSMLLTMSAQMSWAADKKISTKIEKPIVVKEVIKIPQKQIEVLKTPNHNILNNVGGGADTGGGNAMDSRRIYPEDIVPLITNAKFPILYMLRRLEFMSLSLKIEGDSGEFLSLLQKLFKGNKTIFTALHEVELVPLKKGPCLDSLGNEVDASAKNAPQICFSLERLAARLNGDSLEKEILAIIIHEISHTIGTTEREAVYLQNIIRHSTASDAYTKIPMLVETYGRKLKEASENATFILNGLSNARSVQICSGLTMIMTTQVELFQKNMNSLQDGIAFSASREIWGLNAALLKGLNLMSYCQEGEFNDAKRLQSIFNGHQKVPVSEYYRKIYPTTLHNYGVIPPLPNIFVRSLQPGDLNSLKIELQDILDLIQDALDNL